MKHDAFTAALHKVGRTPAPPPVLSKPITPHEQMRKLDLAGDSYVIRFALIGDLSAEHHCEVLSHSDRWLCIMPFNGRHEDQRWISTAAIAWLEVEEL